MKSKLHLQSLAAIFFLIVSLGTAPAQKGPGAPPAVDPNTGLPLPQARTLPALDPVTGLPQSQPTPWKDLNWKDPDIVLTNVSYDGLPLSEVVRRLQDQFKGCFDVLTPVNPDWAADWQSIAIRLQLKNVTASEIFNAMNLVFENDRTPLRWELKLNGKRPTALLRVLAQPSPKNPPPVIDPTTGLPVPPPETKRGVYFVGNLLGDEKSGGLTMEQLVQTLSEVRQIGFGSEGGLQFHKQAQLVIVTGTDAEIEFIGNTLTALRQKEELDAVRQAQSKSAESKPKSEATKTP
ncbi:MAG: hypothetical protein ABSH15_08975 [Verrucomicrobiota bacterium]|jgi:hypothetical protein